MRRRRLDMVKIANTRSLREILHYGTLFCFMNGWLQSTDVDHLSLHVMVRALDTPDKQDLRKLQLLKDELVSLHLLYPPDALIFW